MGKSTIHGHVQTIFLRLPAPLAILAKGNLSDAVAANLVDSDAPVTCVTVDGWLGDLPQP